MLQNDAFMLMVIGGIFILLGIALIIWGGKEEKRYYDAMTSRNDAREFLDHWPQRPQLQALKIGGRIAIALGVVMTIMGGAFLLWG